MSDFVGDPSGVNCGDGISATNDGNRAGIISHGAGDLESSFRKWRNLKYAHGPVPNDGASAGDFFRIIVGGLRADVEAHHVCRNRLAAVHNVNHCVGIDAVGDHMIGWKQELHVAMFRILQNLAGEVELVIFDAALANLHALGFEERISHGAADDEGIDFVEQILNDCYFIADSATPENGDKGSFGMLHSSAQVFELFFHEQTGGRFLNKLCDPDG